MRLVVISAGVSDPSSTGLLSTRLARSVTGLARREGTEISVARIELRRLATQIAQALVSANKGPELLAAEAQLAGADAIVAATPVYKAGISGLFKSFADGFDNDLLVAKPVLLAATAGTARHALVVDEAMRSLFTYLRAVTVPTGVFASQEDWSDPALGARIDRAATELVALARADVQGTIRGTNWGAYGHELGSNAGAETDIELDTDLMRLATGGSAPLRRRRLLDRDDRLDQLARGDHAVITGGDR